METKRKAWNEDAGGFALGILFWVLIWALAARLIGNDILFAGPVDTVRALWENVCEMRFWEAVGNTAGRIVAVGTLASCAGIALGALAWRFPALDKLFAPALHVMKSAPVACVVVVVLVAWGQAGAFLTIVAFVALPPFYVAIREALDARPRQAERVLRLAGVGRGRIFCALSWPFVLPYLISAAKTSVALSWRAGVTAELLTLPLASIGAGVYASKLTLDSAGLLVWTIMVMLLSFVNEKAIVWLLKASRRVQLLGLPKRPCVLSACADERVSDPVPEVASLCLEGVRRAHGDNAVLEDLSLCVAPGERVCLMAPTGSGKTTALSVLMGLDQPDRGSVSAPQRIGAVLQASSLIEGLTASQNVLMCAGADVSAQDTDAALDELLPEGSAHLGAAELSGGMKRLTEIVRALSSDGAAIVLDEPFAGLDVESRERACAFILDHLEGRPLIVATHDERDAQLLDATIIRLP